MQNNNMFIPTFNNDSAYRQALQGIPVFNQPVYNPQSINTQVPVQPQLTPEQIAYIRAQQNQPVVNPQAQELQQNWGGSNVNILNNPILSNIATIGKNAIGDIPQIGTGLVSAAGEIINDPIGVAQRAGQSINDYLTNLYYRSEPQPTGNRIQDKLNQLASPISYGTNIGKDYWNFMQGTLPVLNTQTIGSAIEDIKRGDGDSAYNKLKDAGIESWERFKQDPLIISSIIAPNLTAKGLIGAGKGTLNLAEKAGVPVGDITKQAAKAIQTVESKFSKDYNKLMDKAEELSKANQKDLEIVLQHYAEGTPLPKNLEKLADKFIKFQDDYNLTFDDNALVNPAELSALQYVQRQTGKTMQEIRREVTPQLEMLQEGVTDPRLSFTNRLSNFEHEVNAFRKDNKAKDYLKDSKKINELSDNELATLGKHFDNAELESFRATDMTVKDAKQYLGDLARDSWQGSKISEAALKDIKFQENMGKLANLAETTGNPTLKHLYDGMKLSTEGKIRPYTFAGAEIPEGVKVSNEGRRFQGKSSSREYGTATYEDIAKAYRTVHNFVDDVTQTRIKQEIANNILYNGTIDGVNKIVKDNVKSQDLRYLNPELVADGRLSEALKSAGKNPVEGSIPIDRYSLNSLNSLLSPASTPYAKGILGDIYNLFKESALASGTYLGGNLESGLMGTVLNSATPQGLISDIVSAIGSKGEISKQLGTYRRIRPTGRKYSTGAAQFISNLGRKLGTGVAPRIDAAMQNMFAEINAHGTLRKMGIDTVNRESAIAGMNKMKLGELIENVRLSSMMNNKYRVIPRGALRQGLGIANPFIDWIDTSMQVSAKMLKDHPVLMGAVASKLFGDIAFDKELQNRLKLGVYTDKPLVTYKANPKNTSEAKEISLNFVPQLTWMEFIQNPAKLVTGNSGAPVLSAIYEASKGKTPYGNPMRRTHAINDIQPIMNGTRYRRNPDTGLIEPINTTQADEFLSAAIKNIVAPVNLWNKTVAPIGAGIYNKLTGSDVQYHQPYGQSILGSFRTGQPELGGQWYNAFRTTGDPRNPRSVEDIIKGLGTYYERDYYPQDQLTGNQIRRIIRAGVRQNMRDQYAGE